MSPSQEHELERTISLLRATLDSTTDGILVVDAEGKIVTFNERFVKMWGIPQEVIDSRDDDLALSVAIQQLCDPDEFLSKVRELYDQPEVESFDVLHFLDGRIFERHSLPQRLQGECIGRVWSFRDVTARRRAEEALGVSEQQLRQSSKMEAIGRLAGGVAHDFNNLLMVIQGYCELLTEQLERDSRHRRPVEQVAAAAKKAAALTQQLLAFSRRQVLQPEILSLNLVVEHMKEMMQRLIGEDVDLVFAGSSELGNVRADASQVQQVLMNLAANARDAMPRGGRLTVETANVTLDQVYATDHVAVQPGDYVLLAVSDNGTGMDEMTRSHAFDPFFTTKEKGKGTGLGLSTVYGIVKQSGGNIWIYSEPGRGTTFKIYLPRVAASLSKRELPVPEKLRPPREATVLLVEDEAMVRRLVRQVLTNSGYQLLEAANGAEALELVRGHEGRLDLMVTDVVMPQMSGPELANQLRATHPGTPVLYMSGYTDEAVVHHGVLERGANFLQKPFGPEDLRRKIQQILGGEQAVVQGV
jgi:PAS domain S-box-containing protein